MGRVVAVVVGALQSDSKDGTDKSEAQRARGNDGPTPCPVGPVMPAAIIQGCDDWLLPRFNCFTVAAGLLPFLPST